MYVELLIFWNTLNKMKVVKARDLLRQKFLLLTSRGRSISKLSFFFPPSMLPLRPRSSGLLNIDFSCSYYTRPGILVTQGQDTFFLFLFLRLRRCSISFSRARSSLYPLCPCLFLVSSLKFKTWIITLRAAMVLGISIKSGAEPEKCNESLPVLKMSNFCS